MCKAINAKSDKVDVKICKGQPKCRCLESSRRVWNWEGTSPNDFTKEGITPYVFWKSRRARNKPKVVSNRKIKVLWEWCNCCSSSSIPVSGRMLQEEAQIVAENLEISSFVVLNGWLESFKLQHNKWLERKEELIQTQFRAGTSEPMKLPEAGI